MFSLAGLSDWVVPGEINARMINTTFDVDTFVADIVPLIFAASAIVHCKLRIRVVKLVFFTNKDRLLITSSSTNH